MMVLLRRSVVLGALIFWLGGLGFYGAVVVPVGRQAIGSAQSLVTRDVTFYLNIAALCALPVMAWDTLVARDPSAARCRARWWCCINGLLSVVALFWLHGELAAQMDAPSAAHVGLRWQHHAYLLVGGWQWVCGLTFAVLSLSAWRAEDQFREG